MLAFAAISTAWWSIESRNHEPGLRYRAFVYPTGCNRIYQTKWHSNPHSAVSEAEGYMKSQGITHEMAVS